MVGVGKEPKFDVLDRILLPSETRFRHFKKQNYTPTAVNKISRVMIRN
jgi:hypothetical protein